MAKVAKLLVPQTRSSRCHSGLANFHVIQRSNHKHGPHITIRTQRGLLNFVLSFLQAQVRISLNNWFFILEQMPSHTSGPLRTLLMWYALEYLWNLFPTFWNSMCLTKASNVLTISGLYGLINIMSSWWRTKVIFYRLSREAIFKSLCTRLIVSENVNIAHEQNHKCI